MCNFAKPIGLCLLAVLSAVLLPTESLAQVRMRAEAVSGEPLGVGRVVIDIGKDSLPSPLGSEGLALTEKDGRVFYPAVHNPALGRLMRGVLEAAPILSGGRVREEVGGLLKELFDRPPRTTIYFLFRGKEPLTLMLQARRPHTVTVRPREDRRVHQQALTAWWQQYAAPRRLLQTKPDYPPLVDTFLATTLARRLNLKLPEEKQTASWQEEFAEEVGLTLGTESIRLAMLQDRILGLNHLNQTADQPLPEPVETAALQTPEVADNVPVEQIAMRVPAECVYVRFGSFTNFLWFQDTLAKWGGDAQNLIALRGLDLGTTQRIEQQLVVKQTALSRLLGPTVVADVAIIGTDFCLREGAAFGLLFHANSSAALAADLMRQRAERLRAGGVTEKKVTIAGKKVSYLASADGTVRSYYANDGAYQFVTSSETLVRRFLETTSGGGSLGASDEFRYARSIMPGKNNYSAFVYLSDVFFRRLMSPQYRVEMTRRLQATADIDIVRLAKLMAASEGEPGGTIEELAGSGVLPRKFGQRPDGSQTVVQGGVVHDSLRGHHGTFVPIPDVPVRAVTPAEAAAYRKFAEYYTTQVGRINPAMIGVKRYALKDNRERVVVDVRMSPMGGQLHQFLAKWAGEPDQVQLAPVAGDLAVGELIMQDQRVFVGLRDCGPPLQLADGRLSLIGRLRDVLVGYVGTTGELPWLRWLENRLLIPPDPRRPQQSPVGLLSRRWNEFTVYSLHPEVLDFVLPRLKFQQAERPAQLRLRVGDVSQARMTPFLNTWGYARTRQTSLGNLRLMHALNQQLHVPGEDCKEAAEFLLSAKLICPLGGKYEFRNDAGGIGRWTSTSIRGSADASPLGIQPPQGYEAPPLSWFRGLDLDAILTDSLFSAHAEVIMRSEPLPRPK